MSASQPLVIQTGSIAHRHSHDEELFLVLEGRVTAFLGEKTLKLDAGGFLALPAGGAESHFIENQSSEVARVLVARAKDPRDQTRYGEET